MNPACLFAPFNQQTCMVTSDESQTMRRSSVARKGREYGGQHKGAQAHPQSIIFRRQAAEGLCSTAPDLRESTGVERALLDWNDSRLS